MPNVQHPLHAVPHLWQVMDLGPGEESRRSVAPVLTLDSTIVRRRGERTIGHSTPFENDSSWDLRCRMFGVLGALDPTTSFPATAPSFALTPARDPQALLCALIARVGAALERAWRQVMGARHDGTARVADPQHIGASTAFVTT